MASGGHKAAGTLAARGAGGRGSKNVGTVSPQPYWHGYPHGYFVWLWGFHSVDVAPLVRHVRGTHCPLSTVIVQLPCIFSLSVGPLIQGLPAMRLDLDHECTRSLLYSFTYVFNNRYHDICICVSCERRARATSYPSRYLVESGFTVTQVDQVTLGWGCLQGASHRR